MEFNRELLKVLGHFDTSGLDNLVQVTPEDIQVLGKSFQPMLETLDTESKNLFPEENISHFLSELSKKVVRLNHVGISYFVDNFEEELGIIKTLATDNSLNVYGEANDDPFQKWFFVGNAENWEDPMFEFVLNKRTLSDFWRPHFQIDVDTAMSEQEIIDLAGKYLGEGFVKWKLDVPEVGVVLLMGVLKEVEGVKIALGIGTNIRDTKWHREHGLYSLK